METPDILILDEPMNALDKKGVAEIRELLLHLKEENKTILIVYHNSEDIHMLCDTVHEMDQVQKMLVLRGWAMRCRGTAERAGLNNTDFVLTWPEVLIRVTTTKRWLMQSPKCPLKYCPSKWSCFLTIWAIGTGTGILVLSRDFESTHLDSADCVIYNN